MDWKWGRGFWAPAVALIPNPNGFHNGNPKVTNLQRLLRCLPYLWLLWWDFANCKPHKPLYKSLHTMFDPFFFSLFYSSANMLPSSYQALVKIVLKQGSPHRLFSFVADTIRYSHRSLVAFMQPVRATMMHSGTFFLLIPTDCPAWRSYHCT